VLAVAARLDQSGDAQECQVVADGRLTLAQPITESRHVQLPLAGQVNEDP
jgi:hypothetical protein